MSFSAIAESAAAQAAVFFNIFEELRGYFVPGRWGTNPFV
jgi:hypothetical protein